MELGRIRESLLARRFDFHQEVPHGGVAWRHFARAACFPFLLQFLILGAVTGGNIPSRPSLPWCVVPKRCGPEVMAALRNAAIGLLRTMGGDQHRGGTSP